MQKLHTPFKTKLQLFAGLLVLFGFSCIGATLCLLLVQGLYPIKTSLLAIQAGTATGGFIIGPLLYWQYMEKQSLRQFFAKNKHYSQLLMLIALLTLLMMVVNTSLAYWNMQLKFPTFLKNFEHWAQQQRVILESQLAILTTFHSLKDLCLAILVIGGVAAVGEEILCRGILQHLLDQTFCKKNLSIFLAAFIFSAIHLDPYLFLPRFLMGILYGYLYAWTQNLIFPMLAHFLNNSMVLFIAFLEQKGFLTHTLSHDTLPPWFVVIGCSVMSLFVIGYIQKKTQGQHKASLETTEKQL